MFLNFLRRDLILHKKAVLWFLVPVSAYLVWGSVKLVRPELFTFYIVVSSIMVTLFPMIIIAREDKFSAVATTCSLPITRTHYVGFRYLEAWVLILGTLALMHSLCILVPGSRITLESLVRFEPLFLSLEVITLMLAVLLPFIIRYGLAGMMAFMIATQVLGVLMLLLTRVVFRQHAVKSVFALIPTGYHYLKEILGPAPFFLLVAVTLVILNVISFMISRWIFCRREL